MPWWQFTYAMHTTSAAHKQFYYSARSYASAEYWIHFRSCIVITIFIDFCQLNLTKFEHNTTVCRDESLWNRILKIFCKGSFFQKNAKKSIFFQRIATSGRHNSTVIIDRRKFITNWSLYGISSFHFCRWNQLFKVILLAFTLCTRNFSQIFETSVATWRHTAHNADAGSDDRLLSHVTCPSLQKIKM